MDVKLDKQSKIPVYLQIVDQLRAQIMCGALPSGSVLPSERGLAQMLEVHRNTVVKAYGELKSDAWIESRQGIGYVVAVPSAAEDGGEGEAGASDKPSRRVNWINEIKDRHLDMEKTFDDLFQRFTDESKYSLGSGISTNEVVRHLAVRAHAQTHHENERVDADAQQRIDKAEAVGVAAQARGEQVAGDHDRPVEDERGHREYLPFKKEGGVLRRPPFAVSGCAVRRGS